MATITTVGYVLAGVVAVAIMVIGARFLIAPHTAAAGYGVQPDLQQPAVRAYLNIKGVRDITSGLFVAVIMIAGTPHLLGWIILTATLIPLADAAIVLTNHGPRSIAWGVHGGTAAIMLITTALLFISQR